MCAHSCSTLPISASIAGLSDAYAASVVAANAALKKVASLCSFTMTELPLAILERDGSKPGSACPSLASFTDKTTRVRIPPPFEGRPLHINDRAPALSNCRKLLALARQERFPIAHVQLDQTAFHRTIGGTEWIEGFVPLGREMIFERSKPSCYASPLFREMMEEGGGEAAILAGLAASTSCLATLIDAHEIGHNVRFVGDASSSHAACAGNEPSVHEAAVGIAKQFVEVVCTTELMGELSIEGQDAGSRT